MKSKILKLIRFLAALAHLAGLGLVFTGGSPLFLLPLMAWSFLLFLAADNQLREANSLLLGDPGRGRLLLLASLLFCSLLEATNLFLDHRFWAGVPAEAWLRWPFFIVTFASFLPLVLEIERKLENLGLAEVLLWRRIGTTRGVQLLFLALGLLLLLPLVLSPAYFYPLLWVALLFLTDPLVNLLGRDDLSISGQFEEGYYGQAFRLLGTGLILGFLWEFWNYRAGCKWFYSGSSQASLFELPLLEFWGYAFKALGAYAFFQLLTVLKRRFSGRLEPGTIGILGGLLLLLILGLTLAGMDARTVASFRQVF